MKSFESFKSDATLLVAKFQSARRRVATSSFVTDRLEARRELTDIRKQKENLLSEIDKASFISSEKRELESILSAITE